MPKKNLNKSMRSFKEDAMNSMGNSDGTNNPNKFDVLIDTVLTNFSESQISIQDLLHLKDELLLHYLPPPLLFRVAVVFGQVFRTFSDLNTSVNEMLRLVKIYSAPWEKNGAVLKKIHEMYENKKQMLNIAIKRLAAVDRKTKLFVKERRVMNWERLFIKLSEAKGHGRRWKFQMETFRKKADMGYEELVKWVNRDPGDQEEDQGAPIERRKEKRARGDRGLFDDDDFTMGMDDDENNKEDNDINEVDSDNELFSDVEERQLRNPRDAQPVEPPKEMAEVITQTEPDVESKTTWTGEPNYQRFFLVRLFKPAEFNSKKIKFKLNYEKKTFESTPFEAVKAATVVKPKAAEETKKFGRRGNRKSSPTKVEEKPLPEEEKKVDVTKFEDFVFEMPDFFKAKDGMDTSASQSVGFELQKVIDEHKVEPTAYSNIKIDDINALELPILYYKFIEDLKTIDEGEETYRPVTPEKEVILEKDAGDAANKKKVEPGNKKDVKATPAAAVKKVPESKSLMEVDFLTSESVDMYKLLAKRPPFTFKMYKSPTGKTGDETVCELPVLFFWIRKPPDTVYSKNTNTRGIRSLVKEITGIDTAHMSRKDIEYMIKDRGVRGILDQACSPIPIVLSRPPSSPAGGNRRTSIKSRSTMGGEAKPEVNIEELLEQQENFQMRLDELNLTVLNLENENSELKSMLEMAQYTSKSKNRMSISMSRAGFNQPINLSNLNKMNIKLQQPNAPSVPNMTNYKLKKQKTSGVWAKDLPEDFFERLKLFAERSDAHHKAMLSKYLGQEAFIREQQMAVQHKLDDQDPAQSKLDAVFMPYKSTNNVFNPRAHQYFHPTGSHDVRLTQPPSVIQLPPLTTKQTLPVINLFDLAKRYEAGEPDFYIKEYVNKTAVRMQQENEEMLQQQQQNGHQQFHVEFKNASFPTLTTTDEKQQRAIESEINQSSRIDLNFGLKRNEVILNSKDESNNIE